MLGTMVVIVSDTVGVFIFRSGCSLQFGIVKLNIVSFARAWTGFNRQPYRGNVESRVVAGLCYLDPMKIKDIRRRDLSYLAHTQQHTKKE